MLFKFAACRSPGGAGSQGTLSELGSGVRSGRWWVIAAARRAREPLGLVALLLPCQINPETPAIKPALAKVICGEILSLQ